MLLYVSTYRLRFNITSISHVTAYFIIMVRLTDNILLRKYSIKVKRRLSPLVLAIRQSGALFTEYRTIRVPLHHASRGKGQGMRSINSKIWQWNNVFTNTSATTHLHLPQFSQISNQPHNDTNNPSSMKHRSKDLRGRHILYRRLFFLNVKHEFSGGKQVYLL